MIAQAATVASPEPILVSALVALGGIVILWFAQKVLWLVKMMQSVTIALFGDTNQQPPNGIIRKLNTLSLAVDAQKDKLEAHCVSEDRWKEDAVRLATGRANETMLMLKSIENRIELGRRRNRRTPPKGTP